jgi:hypothetical protein
VGQVGESDIVDVANAGQWLVVGWFTPDYRLWAVRLERSLQTLGVPHHLAACRKQHGTWAAETTRKPQIVAEMMARYPGKTLVLLDVDCTVRRPLEPLVETLKGDVAAFVRAKPTGRGKERARIKILSGTMVFRPTAGAQSFVRAWSAALRECDAADVDQTALMIALGRATDFTFQPLGAEWCALDAAAHPDPAILHDHAGADATRARVPTPREVLRNLVNRMRGRPAPAHPLLADDSAGSPERRSPLR